MIAKFMAHRDMGDVYEIYEEMPELGVQRLIGFVVANNEEDAIKRFDEI
jgi:hypothetical protein